jgi:hypothetical protein
MFLSTQVIVSSSVGLAWRSIQSYVVSAVPLLKAIISDVKSVMLTSTFVADLRKSFGFSV